MKRSRSRSTFRSLVLALSAVLVTLALAPASASASTACPTGWGSLPKSSSGPDPAHDFVYNVRAGQHACFDRLVVDLGVPGPFNTYSVRYVDTVRHDGSGFAVPLRGGARLEIIVGAMNYDEQRGVTYRPRNPSELVNVSGYRTFRQVAWAGAFEGQSTVGLGVRARLPYRVFTLPAGGAAPDTKVVIDVAHTW